jgi:hypothetical protein
MLARSLMYQLIDRESMRSTLGLVHKKNADRIEFCVKGRRQNPSDELMLAV